jgi:hypothetical protein
MKTLVLFIVGAVLFGAVALGVGFLLTGAEALVQGGTAFALAFVPAAGTLAWVLTSYRTVPDMQLLASLGGSGVRMAIALGGGLLLTTLRPETFALPFWCWLSLFYLGLLGFEMTLLVRQQPKPESGLLVEDSVPESGVPHPRTGGNG